MGGALAGYPKGRKPRQRHRESRSVASTKRGGARPSTSRSVMSLIFTTNVENQEELMLRKLMLVTVAGALTMVQGAAAVAQAECGGIWAAHCNAPKGPKSKASDKAQTNDAAPAASASPNAEANANENSAVAGATPPKASATGMANASPNSAAATGTTGAAANANAAVVAGAGALGASSIAGIAAGQDVKGSDGTVLGKISQVMKGPDGSISKVIVTSSSGRSFPVAAGKLSVSGGAVIVSE